MREGMERPYHLSEVEPLSLWERGWGEGAGAYARFQLSLRPHPHPPAGTFSRREKGSCWAIFGLWPYATTTGIFPMRACHSFGPVWCTDVPAESTATVTGMSFTSNS